MFGVFTRVPEGVLFHQRRYQMTKENIKTHHPKLKAPSLERSLGHKVAFL